MQVILLGGGGRRLALTLTLSAVLAIGMIGILPGSASAATCTSATAITPISYRLTGPPPPSLIRTVPRLKGNVNQGDAIDQVTFNINAACTSGVNVNLVSYAAPGSTWDPNTAGQQVVVDSEGSTSMPPGGPPMGPYFGPGQHTLSLLPVKVPAGCFQVDLVVGTIIQQFSPPGGTYSGQGRLVDFDNGDPGCTPLV